MKFKETNCHNIYRTPLSQTLRRPIHEPPDIDILGLLASKDVWDKFLKRPEYLSGPPGLKTQFIDQWLEHHTLHEYQSWAGDVCGAWHKCGDWEKKKYYWKFMGGIGKDMMEVHDEVLEPAMKAAELQDDDDQEAGSSTLQADGEAEEEAGCVLQTRPQQVEERRFVEFSTQTPTMQKQRACCICFNHRPKGDNPRH